MAKFKRVFTSVTASLGMCISGIGVLCPEKRGTISRLIFKSMLGGVFVSIVSLF